MQEKIKMGMEFLVRKQEDFFLKKGPGVVVIGKLIGG